MYYNISGEKMRRKEREITDFEKILKILDEAEYLTLALLDDNGPYSVPVNFGYLADSAKKSVRIFIHGALEGTKISCIKKCPKAAFSAVSHSEIGKEKEPCGWTNFYKSVCGSGTASLAVDSDEKKQGLLCILKKYGYKGPAFFPAAMMARTSVIKIDVEKLSGKAHEK